MSMVMRISADAEIAKSMTLDEGPRRIASNIAKLPKLLGKQKLVD